MGWACSLLSLPSRRCHPPPPSRRAPWRPSRAAVRSPGAQGTMLTARLKRGKDHAGKSTHSLSCAAGPAAAEHGVPSQRPCTHGRGQTRAQQAGEPTATLHWAPASRLSWAPVPRAESWGTIPPTQTAPHPQLTWPSYPGPKEENETEWLSALYVVLGGAWRGLGVCLFPRVHSEACPPLGAEAPTW